MLAAGIWASAFVMSRAVLAMRLRWTAAGGGVLVLATVIALALPGSTVGAPPTVPCSTPGPDGPITGRCVTGPAPSDERLDDRALVIFSGVMALLAGGLLDRRR